MATTAFKPPPAVSVPPSYRCSIAGGGSKVKSRNFARVCFVSYGLPVMRCRSYRARSDLKFPSRSVMKFLTFAADGEPAETEVKDRVEGSEYEIESESESEAGAEIEWNTDGAVGVYATGESDGTVVDDCSSAVIAHLNSYKEAVANKDEAKVTEVESFLKSLEDDKNDLEKTVVALSKELSCERDWVLRIGADFDNFRKRTETERLSLVSNAKGEVVERLLPVLDNFERAKAQIKVETDGEEKINNSYQSINKQFVEILASLGVVPVETVGKPFDPMLHEAIMREESTEYEDGIIIEEYRKGFQLGERLLRPSMVKVSSGPGPTKPETGGQSDGQKEVN